MTKMPRLSRPVYLPVSAARLAALRTYAARHGLSLPEALDQVLTLFFDPAAPVGREPAPMSPAWARENLYLDEK
ncbi:hypothetical protein AWN76_014375 [Rhodothermaceae bacterium RA]|nr:hypothetical protein AWN76_014375 [Rhodothermaceae bacterium RA]